VKLGYMDGEWAEVLSGLKQGDQVVTAGMVARRDGWGVQVLGAPPPNATASAKPAAKKGAKQ
jgi:multidrug efflux pump subunit AcrA (membrane-fusion protein)